MLSAIMAFPIPQPPRRGFDRRYSREDERRMMAALADLALSPDQPEDDAQPINRRILARITGIANPAANLAVYSWEYAVPLNNGRFKRDAAGFAGTTTVDPDSNDRRLPAWEASGNTKVPIDGSCIVELLQSAGGYYYTFFYPSLSSIPYALITGAAGRPHAWVELAAEPGGNLVVMSSGRSGTTTTNPAYALSGATNVPAGTVVSMNRGYGACPDVATAITTHGDGTATHQVQTITLTHAVSGSWNLTLTDAGGVVTTIGPFAWNITAAALQTAVRAVANFTTATVTGFGTLAAPFVVTMADTFVDLAVLAGDPFPLTGIQEWFFVCGGCTSIPGSIGSTGSIGSHGGSGGCTVCVTVCVCGIPWLPCMTLTYDISGRWLGDFPPTLDYDYYIGIMTGCYFLQFSQFYIDQVVAAYIANGQDCASGTVTFTRVSGDPTIWPATVTMTNGPCGSIGSIGSHGGSGRPPPDCSSCGTPTPLTAAFGGALAGLGASVPLNLLGSSPPLWVSPMLAGTTCGVDSIALECQSDGKFIFAITGSGVYFFTGIAAVFTCGPLSISFSGVLTAGPCAGQSFTVTIHE